MITQPPIGLITTFSQQMIEYNGGKFSFMRSFLACMDDSDNTWLHRSKNKPRFDILYAYIIIAGKLRYRVNYVGYDTGPAIIYRINHQWQINWPRMILAGPLVKAPYEIKMQGFQGFRYVYDELF